MELVLWRFILAIMAFSSFWESNTGASALGQGPPGGPSEGVSNSSQVPGKGSSCPSSLQSLEPRGLPRP